MNPVVSWVSSRALTMSVKLQDLEQNVPQWWGHWFEMGFQIYFIKVVLIWPKF